MSEISIKASVPGAEKAVEDIKKIAGAEKEVAAAAVQTESAEKKLGKTIQERMAAAEKEVELRQKAHREERDAAQEKAKDAEQSTQGNNGSLIGSLGKLTAAAALVGVAFKGAYEFAKVGAAAGDAGARQVVQDFDSLGKSWQSIKASIGGSGLAKIIGNVVSGFADFIGPSDEARKKTSAFAESMEDLAKKSSLAGVKLAAVTEEIRIQNKWLAQQLEITKEQAEVGEKEVEFNKRRQLAGVSPDLNDVDRAKAVADIERAAAQETTRLRDQLATKQAAAAQLEAENIKQVADHTEAYANNIATVAASYKERAQVAQSEEAAKQALAVSEKLSEEAAKQRAEAAKLDQQALEKREQVETIGRQRDAARRVEVGDRVTTGVESQAKIADLQAKADEKAATEKKNADEKAAREKERAEKDAARDRERALKASGNDFLADDPALQAASKAAAGLAGQVAGRTAFGGQKDLALQDLKSAADSLQDGATLAEISRLAAVLKQFSASLAALRFGDQIANVQNKLGELQRRSAQTRSEGGGS